MKHAARSPYLYLLLALSSLGGCCRSLEPACRAELSARTGQAAANTQRERARPEEERGEPGELPEWARARHLRGLHPVLTRRAVQLVKDAAAEGIQLYFISGYRPYRPRTPRRAGGSLASWHSFGNAFDLNMRPRRSMEDALAHFEEDEARWRRVGALAESLGLTWGLQWGRKEVFHFEWHPGQPDAIRARTLRRLLNLAGDDGVRYRETWSLYRGRQ